MEQRRNETMMEIFYHVRLYEILQGPNRREQRMATVNHLKDKICQNAQHEAIARDDRNTQPRHFTGRTSVPIPPFKKADTAGATAHHHRAGHGQGRTEDD